MATIRKRGNSWYCQIRRKGSPIICKTFKEKSDAELFALEIEDSIQKDRNQFSTVPCAYKLPVTNLDLLVLYKNTLKRAKSSGLDHSLTADEFIEIFYAQDGKCAVSGIYFAKGKDVNWRCMPYYPSLDRISSSKGYSKDNVRFVLTAVNIALSDWGDAVLKDIAFGIVSKSVSTG